MSTTISIRMEDELRDRLTANAQERGRSLNREIVASLGEAVSGESLETFLVECELPRVVRVKSSGTHRDVERVQSLLRALPIDHVVLAAKADDLNGAALVMALETSNRVFVLDSSMVNMGRSPREWEVRRLMQALDRRKLLASAHYHPDLIEDTSGIAVEKAARIILRGEGIRPLGDVAEYLPVLARHEHFDVDDFRSGAAEGRQA